jgi:hypothetical protein
MLICKVNPAWIAIHTRAAADVNWRLGTPLGKRRGKDVWRRVSSSRQGALSHGAKIDG